MSPRVRYWTCRKCGRRQVRTRSPRCVGCGENTKPPIRRPAHTAIMQGDTYAEFDRAARLIHAVTDERCCACGKPKPERSRHNRDHDHRTGKPRGLLCAGNQGCNALIPPWLDAARAQAIADYLRRVETASRCGLP